MISATGMSKKVLRRVLLSLAIVVLVLFVFAIGLILYLNSEPGQKRLGDYVLKTLSEKLKTTVTGKISYGFPDWVKIENLLLKDQKADTLIFAKNAKVDIDMWAYLDNKLAINNVKLEDASINVYHNGKSFNYEYALEAFASTGPKDTSSVPLSFELKNIEAQNLNLKYKDYRVGHDLNLELGNLKTGFFSLKPDINLYHLKDTEVADVFVSGKIGKSPTDTSSNKSTLPDFQFKNLNAKNLNWNLTIDGNSTAGKELNLTVGIDKINLPKNEYSIATLKSNAKSIVYKVAKQKGAPNGQINFSDLLLTELNLETKNINYKQGDISGILSKLNLKEQSGLEIKKLYTQASLKNNELELSELNLQTNNSELISSAKVDLNPKDYAKSTFKYHLTSSKLALSDALFFSQKLKQNPYFKNLSKDIIKINGQINGNSNSVNFENLTVFAPQNSNLKVTGLVRDFDNPNFDLNILNLESGRKDILRIVPSNQIPENIEIPEHFVLSGKLKGKIDDLLTDISLKSEQGLVQLNSHFTGLTKSLAYSGTLKTTNYDVGRLIKNPTISGVTSSITFSGKGTDLKTADVNLKGTVSKAFYEGKQYENISFDGKLKDQLIDTKLAVDDPGANFTWVGTVDLSTPEMQIIGKTKVNFVNLKSLGLSDENIEIKGDFDLKNFVLDPKSPIIDLEGKNVMVYRDDKLFPIGDLKAKTTNTGDNQKVAVSTSFMDVSLSGKFEYDQIKNITLNEVNNYFKLLDYKPIPQTQKYNFKLNGVVNYDPVFTAFLPSLKAFSTINIDATLQSEGNIPISGKIIVPYLQYDSIKVFNTTFDYVGDRTALNYALQTEQITNNDLRIRNANIVGKLENNIGSFDLSVKDSLQHDIHSLTGFVQSKNNQLQITFDEHGTMLFYEPWAGNPYSSITYSSKGIHLNDVIFTSKNQILRVNSLTNEPNGPISIFSQNLDLNFLSKAFLQDSTLIAGYADLDLEILNYMTESPSFTGDFTISDFAFNQAKMGKLEGKAESNTLDQIKLNATLSGQTTDMTVSGFYFPKREESLDFKANIKNIDLLAIHTFVKDILTNIDGNLSGDFTVKGSAKNPEIKGEATFEKFNFTLIETGAKLKLIKQKVIFENQMAILNNINLLDENNKVMVLNGKINLNKLPEYSYNLDINAKNFKLVNAKSGQNELFKGVGFFDADLKLNGKNLDFKLTGDVGVQDSTNIILLLPDEANAASELESVVKFVNFNQAKDEKKEEKKELVISFANAVNINVDVPAKATLNILMDPITGDLMTVNGQGKLNVGFDNKGDLFMLGRYAIDKGRYELTYQAIKKVFLINPTSNSYIVWSGDPMAGNLEITAEYNAGKKALAGYPFKTSTQEKLKELKLAVPIRIDLRVLGILSSPEVVFELVTKATDVGPEVKTLIEAEGFRTVADNGTKSTNDPEFKSNQVNINANAIMLLIGGVFNASQIGQNLSDIKSYENFAREKVSDLISSQLDKYASGLIKGIDLNLGLQSAYNTTNSTGNTNLNLGVSKKLANDRLSFTVGKNFELENKDMRSNEIFDNVEANWLITKDGRFRLKVFRKNLNQMVIEGSVIETGLGFIIAIDYETWKELMKRK